MLAHNPMVLAIAFLLAFIFFVMAERARSRVNNTPDITAKEAWFEILSLYTAAVAFLGGGLYLFFDGILY